MKQAASEELSVPFSNILGHGFYREAGEPQPIWETDEDGEQQLVGYRADPGILWPDGYDGPKRIEDTFNDPDLPPARKLSWGLALSSVQQGTPIMGREWLNIAALCNYLGIYVQLGGLTYGKGFFEHRPKKGSVLDVAPWSAEIKEYVTRERMTFPCGVTFAAEMNIPIAAANPLAGMEAHCAGTTNVFPHAKRALQTLPRNKCEEQSFMWTTCSLTAPNFILKNAGQKAIKFHQQGCLLVLVDPEERVFTHNIECDPVNGDIWYFDICVTNGRVRRADTVRAERDLQAPGNPRRLHPP